MTRSRSRFIYFILFVLAGTVGYFLFFRPTDQLRRTAVELDDLIQPESIAKNMKVFAEKPHRSGTPENRLVGDRIISELRAMGANVWFAEHSAQLPQPGNAKLWLTAPVNEEIDFSEKSVPSDPYSIIAAKERPFFAYIKDADVEAEVIYANFGDRKDYELLKDRGISVAGKIALVRTQGTCRGMKQMVAEEEGLAGLLLYPEPQDQGFRKVAYPDGPGINPWVAQRGSMLKFFMYPGDPDALDAGQRSNAEPTVPALPITPEAAQIIFNRLHGPAFSEWRGRMKAGYNIGPGPAHLRITTSAQRSPAQIRSIFATLGGIYPSDPSLLVSTHYDAWLYGASDPGSGTAVVLETAKALFGLEKKGWKPKRNIVFAFWDAEEFGMIGSTRWVQNTLLKVRSGIGNVLYVDSVRGPILNPTVAPGMREMLDEVLERFTDPNTGKSVREFHVAYQMPGFSDDTIPFSSLAGVPVAQLNYGVHYTMYHSIYDNLSWMEKFGDPNYAYAANLAKILSLYAFALTLEERLPFQFSEFSRYYEKTLSRMKLENAAEDEVAAFDRAIQKLRELANLGEKIEGEDFSHIPGKNIPEINALLQQAVVCFTEPSANSNSSFSFRNILMGPSPENECAGIELPGIRRALLTEQRNGLNVELMRLNVQVSKAIELLKKAIIVMESKR